jgi:hypothetical protein
MIKKIKFYPLNDKVSNCVPSPEPANGFIPKWFRDMESYMNGKKTFDPNQIQSTFKKCAPVLDSFLVGYIQKLWCDIDVKQGPEGAILTWGVNPNPVENRNPMQMTNWAVPDYLDPTPFIWGAAWGIKTPESYSILVTHPLNRDDLPFRTLSGVIDSDNFYLPGNVPFYLKKGFEGIIPTGTPLYQIIPIKRQSWFKSNVKFNSRKMEKLTFNLRKVIYDSYKKTLWIKKEYK